MTDQYGSYYELQNNHQEEHDYHIRTLERSKVLIILAIHAGRIEMGTSELAEAIAREDFSMYLFEGFARNSQILHITSTHFDEPRCLDLIQKHQTSLSLHGFAGTQSDPMIYLGGNNLALVKHLLDALVAGGYPTQINTGKYAATDPANICNRTYSDGGVQIELSAHLRSRFFEDYLHRKGREKKTPQFDYFVQLVRRTLLTYTGLA